MISKGIAAIVLTAGLVVACSKSETQLQSVNSSQPIPVGEVSGLSAPNYQLICERLITLAPEKRKAALADSCVTEYQHMLPSCQNASAVNNCYASMKDWGERLVCLDSCVRK